MSPAASSDHDALSVIVCDPTPGHFIPFSQASAFRYRGIGVVAKVFSRNKKYGVEYHLFVNDVSSTTAFPRPELFCPDFGPQAQP